MVGVALIIGAFTYYSYIIHYNPETKQMNDPRNDESIWSLAGIGWIAAFVFHTILRRIDTFRKCDE